MPDRVYTGSSHAPIEPHVLKRDAVANLISDEASSFQPAGSHEPGADIPDNTAAHGSP